MYWVLVWEIGPVNNMTRCSGLSKRRLPHAFGPTLASVARLQLLILPSFRAVPGASFLWFFVAFYIEEKGAC